jgi:CRP-like cAMP-binding protein
VKEGESSDCIYILRDGALRVFDEKGAILEEIHEPGRVCGEHGFVSGRPISRTFKAVRKSKVLVMKKEDLKDLVPTRLRDLKTVPIFQYVPDGDIEKLKTIGTMKVYNAGEVVLEKGDEGPCTFNVILCGAVEIRGDLHEVDLMRDLVLGPGEFFGEEAIFSRDLRQPRYVVALRDLHILQISHRDFKGKLMSPVREQLEGSLKTHGRARSLAPNEDAPVRKQTKRGSKLVYDIFTEEYSNPSTPSQHRNCFCSIWG